MHNDCENKYPIPDEKIFHGLAGEIIKMIENETEADTIALLISFFVSFGNIIGRNAYYEVEATKHYPNLFAVLVGESSKGRKGTSWAISKRIFENIDKDWTILNIKSGLSSGEGLKYNVRDKTKKIEKGLEVTTDDGVLDKRLLVYESEYAGVLKVANRAGNTLTSTIRDAWDTGYLSTLTKHDPIIATNAHISILAHITTDELRRNLTDTEAANGFANRFLWVSVKRSKLLPHGGIIPFEQIAYERLKHTTSFHEPKQIRMTLEARKLWADIYTKLSIPDAGLLGAITSRGEAQVIRLALIYALIDGHESITTDHLQAGEALWNYCFQSAKYIFGEKFGNGTVDTILQIIKNNTNGGVSLTELHKHFGNNKSKIEIDRALSLLSENNKIKLREEKTSGRPITWYELNELN